MICYLNQIITLFSEPFIAVMIAQIVGLIILLAGLDNDKEIASRSGTYYGFNPHMLKHLISNNYDLKVGIFIFTLPTILQAIKDLPFWVSYLCLFIGLVLRFSPIRKLRIENRKKKIETIISN